jgi:hypothetical protein
MTNASGDLRYPVGRFQRPASELSAAQRSAAIATIASCPQRMASAVKGLTDAQLDTPYRPDGWMVRQVVHHVADSHLNMYCRVRLTLTEDNPTIRPYAENEWSALVDARTLPPDVSLRLLDATHARLDVLLKSLAPEQFRRPFTHPESGAQTLDSLLALYDWHSRHHEGHITELRRRMGW